MAPPATSPVLASFRLLNGIVELGTAQAAAGRVVAVTDTTGVTRQLLPDRFTNLSEGRLGVLARPGMRRASWLAADVLAALGCRDDVSGAGRAGEGDWDHVSAWLATYQVHHLYIRHAWNIRLPILDTLLELLHRTSCTLWLVGDTPFTDGHVETLQPWTSDTVTGEEFLTRWADLDTGGAAQPADELTLSAGIWPVRVPDDDFTTFRAACRDLLSPGAFTVVDAHFRAGVAEAESQAAALPATTDAREVAVAGWLHEHWEQTESMAAYIVFVRAAQVGFFRAGWHLQVDLDQLIGTASTMPRRALRSPELWERLRAYPEPHRGAICALAAAGLPIDTIRGIAVGGVDTDKGSVLLPDGTSVAVPADARLFLTAQAQLRRLRGADTAAPLFPASHGRALSGAAVAQVINDARRELGVAVASDRLDRKPVTGDRWFTRWGISLKELT